MIRLIWLRLWPALIPLLLYFAWIWWRNRHARETGEVVSLRDGPWIWAVGAAFAIAVISLFLLGLEHEQTGAGTYIPPKMEGGKIVDGHFATD